MSISNPNFESNPNPILPCLFQCLFNQSPSYQRWSRGHKARGQGQGHKKIRGQGQGQPFRGQTLSRPRTGMLEAKDQGHKAQVLSKKKKKRSSQKFFRRSPKKKKKRSSQKFFKRSPLKNVFEKILQALHKILTFQKILLSSSRGQANFRGLEAKAKDLTFEAKAKDFKMCPRGLHLCQLFYFPVSNARKIGKIYK